MTGTDNIDAVADSRRLIRTSFKAALATLDPQSGAPYVSLITVATDLVGAPIFLISTLAKHTQNLNQDNRASLLFDGTGAVGDPLTGPRVSLSGRAMKDSSERSRTRFLSRHPQAEAYADFDDFSFYRLEIEHGHFVGGFGRIHDISAASLLIDITAAEPLIDSEKEIVDHMNADHTDAIQLYATRLLNGADGDWRMSGCDPEGCDLVDGNEALRLTFRERAASPDAVRKILVALVQEARNG